MSAGHKLSWLIIIALTFLYFSFPSGLSTGDGWGYAASVKFRNELFLPHHLLYNALGFVFCQIPSLMGFEVISSMKVMNAIFALLILISVKNILSYIKLNQRQVAVIVGLVGFSFSVIRYATENETYIVPLFFALIASFNYLKYIDNSRLKNLLQTAFWASISILFHQSYIFWWLGLLFGVFLGKRGRHILYYLFVSLIVPVSYLLVIYFTRGGLNINSISDFIYGDFNTGARLSITSRGIFFSVVNLIRSFIQVHGYMINMVKENLAYILPGIISVTFVVFAVFKFPVLNIYSHYRRFSLVHVIILGLQFIFAVVSSGNAEFMVMIPVLVFLLFPLYSARYEKFLLRLLVGIALWNISYGLIPLHFKDPSPEQFLCTTAQTGNEKVIIASDDQLIKNMIYYQTGVMEPSNIFKSPAVLQNNSKDASVLDDVIVNAINQGKVVYTNCLNEKTISRSSIIDGTINSEFLSKYEVKIEKSWEMITGKSSVHRIVRRH